MLLGILDGCVNIDNEDIAHIWELRQTTCEEREKILEDILVFLNVLMISSDVIFDVVSSPSWFNILLKIVDVNEETGK